MNSIYAGIHWAVRKKHADEAHLCVKVACKGIKPFAKAVSLDFQPITNKRGYDVSNYAYTAKLLEDGLVACGVIGGDDARFVKKITLHTPLKVKGEHMTVVTIVEDEE